jgi:hypothetical protein
LDSNLRSWFSRPVACAPHEAEVEKHALVRLYPEADVDRRDGTLLPGSSADLGKLIADETEKWGKVVKFAGANPD